MLARAWGILCLVAAGDFIVIGLGHLVFYTPKQDLLLHSAIFTVVGMISAMLALIQWHMIASANSMAEKKKKDDTVLTELLVAAVSAYPEPEKSKSISPPPATGGG